MTEGAPAPLDQRVVRSKTRVLEETYRLLSEGGMGGVSVRRGLASVGRGEDDDLSALADPCGSAGSALEQSPLSRTCSDKEC